MTGGERISLTICGEQYLVGEEAPIVTQMQVQALYYERGESRYLLYEEQPEGYPELMKTRVKFRQGYLEMNRQGTFGCRMVFEDGKTYRTEYVTPLGKLLLDIVTDSVMVEQGGQSDGLSVCVETDGVQVEQSGYTGELSTYVQVGDVQTEPSERLQGLRVTVKYVLENEGQPIGDYRLCLESSY